MKLLEVYSIKSFSFPGQLASAQGLSALFPQCKFCSLANYAFLRVTNLISRIAWYLGSY